MKIIGLTGSIAMGKSTAANALRRMGLPLHDSDATVHRLMGPGGGAVSAVAAAFPGVEMKGAINRQALGKAVFGDPSALKRLEAILHPLVRKETRRFIARQRRLRRPLVVLDIPLLFETGGEVLCDYVVVVEAPAFLQEARVMARSGMTTEKWRSIRARQMSAEEKRRRADFVVPTGLSRGESLRRLQRIIKIIRNQKTGKRAFA